VKPNRRITAALAFSAIALAGCYVVPVVDPQGNVQYHHYPLPPSGVPVAAAPGAHPVPHPAQPFPAILNARLYPDNEIAAQTGLSHGAIGTTVARAKKKLLSAHDALGRTDAALG